VAATLLFQFAGGCSSSVSPFGLPNAPGSDTLSGSVQVTMPSQTGVTGVCGVGTWRVSETTPTLGLSIAARRSDGNQACPSVRFGDSAFVGLLYSDSLLLRHPTSVTLSMSARTSGALVNWLLPDINAFLVQIAEPSGTPLRATLVNYVTFARTIEPPTATELEGLGTYAVRVLVLEKIHGECGVARGSTSKLTLGPMSLTSTVAPPVTASAKTLLATCR